ncbi:MAG: methylenetetrahydrofolate reductase [NAD(P)H] [Rhodocyclaceae bacterium]
MKNLEISVEFFPPQTDNGLQNLDKTCQNLQNNLQPKPKYYSVTYGAGGSTRDKTFAAVKMLKQQGLIVAPHLSCIGASQQNINEILDHYKNLNIKKIVALRGDLPSGMAETGEFQYASDLVKFIRNKYGDYFDLIVAAYPEFHPQAKNAQSDISAFVEKAKAGANAAITQYFYNVDAYFNFVEEVQKKGVEIPIIPGIMPISSYSKLARFSDACGAEIPRWIRKKFESFGDDTESVKKFGVEVVSKMCEKLLQNGVKELHFYSMNQADLVLQIAKNL